MSAQGTEDDKVTPSDGADRAPGRAHGSTRVSTRDATRDGTRGRHLSGRNLILGVVLAVLVQTGMIGQMIWARAAILRDGTEVILQTGFVDPRDLFRGHYVRLNLTISRVSLDETTVPEGLEPDDPVWVSLSPDEEGFWQVAALHAAPPAEGPALRGRLLSTYGGEARIRFPFDRYFAPELRAKELENLRREQRLGIVLAVTPDGVGAVKGITIDGTVIYDEPLL